jgi:ribosomal protein S18 acetylase RimI-like enzyme
MLEAVHWSDQQIHGQIEAISKFLKDEKSIVLLLLKGREVIGYISAQFYSWNRLGQIHGLVIHPHYRRRGLASQLVRAVDAFMRENHARGMYVDTPASNEGGCAFYIKSGFKKAYVMPEYYDVGEDGVSFLKLF